MTCLIRQYMTKHETSCKEKHFTIRGTKRRPGFMKYVSGHLGQVDFLWGKYLSISTCPTDKGTVKSFADKQGEPNQECPDKWNLSITGTCLKGKLKYKFWFWALRERGDGFWYCENCLNSSLGNSPVTMGDYPVKERFLKVWGNSSWKEKSLVRRH